MSSFRMSSFRMSSFRRYIYAGLLALSSLSVAPTLASGQQLARGHFTLPHDVRWDNALVPAGDYRFSVESGAIEVVRLDKISLDKISGSPAGYLFVVHATEDSKPTDTSRILLDRTTSGRYVSALELPGYGMTLRFAVPVLALEKEVAKASAPAAAVQ